MPSPIPPMLTFTVLCRCSAGHVQYLLLDKVYPRKADAERFAAVLDGSISPETNDRMRTSNEAWFRIGRCAMPSCDEFFTATVLEGDQRPTEEDDR